MSDISRAEALPVFLDQSEILLSSLTRGALSHLLLGGGLRSRFILLTDRRVYFSGKQLRQGRLRFAQVIIPLDSISSMSIVETQSPILAMFAIILLLAGTGISFLAESMIPIGISAFLSMVVLLAYGLSRHLVCSIASSSAKIEIDFQLYGEERTRQFIRDLGVAIDQARGLNRLHADAPLAHRGSNEEDAQYLEQAEQVFSREAQARLITGVVRRRHGNPHVNES
jgi:hypothetical protein